MKYNTAKKLFIVGCVGGAVGLGWLVFHDSGEPKQTARRVEYSEPPRAAVPYRPPVPAPTAVPAVMPGTLEIKGMLEAWLSAHGDRNGKMRMNNILPAAPFIANVIRFEEKDAVRFSNDPRQWSQFRLDLNRDGVMDEKWLIVNGRIDRREPLGADGKTVTGPPQYFDR